MQIWSCFLKNSQVPRFLICKIQPLSLPGKTQPLGSNLSLHGSAHDPAHHSDVFFFQFQGTPAVSWDYLWMCCSHCLNISPPFSIWFIPTGQSWSLLSLDTAAPSLGRFVCLHITLVPAHHVSLLAPRCRIAFNLCHVGAWENNEHSYLWLHIQFWLMGFEEFVSVKKWQCWLKGGAQLQPHLVFSKLSLHQCCVLILLLCRGWC